MARFVTRTFKWHKGNWNTENGVLEVMVPAYKKYNDPVKRDTYLFKKYGPGYSSDWTFEEEHCIMDEEKFYDLAEKEDI